MSLFSEYSQVTKLLQQKQQVVFYAESKHYYPYYQQLINDLLFTGMVKICYITSDANDPLLKTAPAHMKAVYVKWMLGFLFSRISADVMIMTMPDLGNFLFKRSVAVGSYIYLFHAAVSTHQQYRQSAFFNYDCIFCTGDYQQQEIRAAEKKHGQQAKEIVHYGYPLFDEIKRRTKSKERRETTKTILIAPSWFDGCIFDSCLEELLKQLEKIPYKVILRSHPEYEKRKKKEFKKIQRLIAAYPNMSMDDVPSVMDRLPLADILITDRSGIAFEFAFGVGKPTLFIETTHKQINSDWQELGIEPIENSMRNELGIQLQVAELNEIPAKIKEIEMLSQGFEEKMKALARDSFYNSTESYKEGFEYVLTKLQKS